MGFSFGGLIGGDSGDSSSNSTQNYDQSHRESVASQSGASVLGSSNIVNDTGLVSIGLQNNSLATNIISHINDTNTALIGKLADVVKTTSNDALTTSLSGAKTVQETQAANSNLLSGVSDNIQKAVMYGAIALGAWYFLGHPGK